MTWRGDILSLPIHSLLTPTRWLTLRRPWRPPWTAPTATPPGMVNRTVAAGLALLLAPVLAWSPSWCGWPMAGPSSSSTSAPGWTGGRSVS